MLGISYHGLTDSSSSLSACSVSQGDALSAIFSPLCFFLTPPPPLSLGNPNSLVVANASTLPPENDGMRVIMPISFICLMWNCPIFPLLRFSEGVNHCGPSLLLMEFLLCEIDIGYAATNSGCSYLEISTLSVCAYKSSFWLFILDNVSFVSIICCQYCQDGVRNLLHCLVQWVEVPLWTSSCM